MNGLQYFYNHLICLLKNKIVKIKKSKNILFLHGLESHLIDDKKAILNKFGNVMAPHIDYHANPDAIATLFREYANQNIDYIIGSSMGGFAGFYLSAMLDTPALLFNPALPYRSQVAQNIPIVGKRNYLMQFVIGQQDDIILAKDNLEYIVKLLPASTDIKIHIIKNLGHRISLEVFESETNLFFLK